MCGKKFLCVWATSVYKETFVWTTGVLGKMKKRNLWTWIDFVYRPCDVKRKSSNACTEKVCHV